MLNELKVRTWIWVALVVIVILGGSFTYWYTSGYKGTSPIKLATISPSMSASSSVGVKVDPKVSANSTATPIQTSTPSMLTGWKNENNTIYSAGSSNVAFSVNVKNDWKIYNQSDTAHGPVFYTSNNNCQAGQPTANYLNCWDYLVISLSDISSNDSMIVKSYTISSQKSGNIWVGVNKLLTNTDQNIIFDSFKITADNRY